MKKWIICVIVFIVLLIVGYGVYVFVFIMDDGDKCMQYSLDHPFVRCPSEHDGKTRYCREVYCSRGKLSENCRTKQKCKG